MEGVRLQYVNLSLLSEHTCAILTPMIEKAIEHSLGEYALTDILAEIASGDILLWVAVDEDNSVLGVWGGSIVQFPRVKVLVIKFLGGRDLEKWEAAALTCAERWAADQGCDVLEACARKGFSKKASRFGFTEVYRIFSKTITQGVKAN